MAIARKINTSALSGIHLHDGFLGEETLLRLIQHDNFRTASQSLINDKLRSFRENYREYSRNLERLQKRKQTSQIQALVSGWANSIVNYLGYQGFSEKIVKHWDDGKVLCLAPKDDSHSVAIFFSVSSTTLTASMDDRSPLTTQHGEVLSSSSRKEALSEQVEKGINLLGAAEAILITPVAIYYFRADSQVSGQCLECRWDEMLLEDNDQALALATYLLRAEAFSFVITGTEAKTEDVSEESTETEDEDGNGSLKLTQSNELFRENLDQAREITEDLHKQVVLALELLINERLAIDPDLRRKALKPNSNERISQDLFKDGLFVLYRILFILYAESRGFLPVENRRFSSFYSLEHLRDWAEDFLRKRNRGIGNSEGTYLWGALKSIFTLLRRGVTLPGGEFVSPYNGQLFAPDRAPNFDNGPALRDEAIAGLITALTRVGGSASDRRLHFANLGVEQLGAVYEALLAQRPAIVSEESVWVAVHGGGVGLVEKKLAKTLEMPSFGDERTQGTRGNRRRQSRESLEKFIDPRRPAFVPSVGKFIIAPLGGQKRQTASFYTPPKLAEDLVKRTLKPLISGKSSKDILSLRLVEPAMGSGGFLIQSVRYLADQLLKAKVKERSVELRSGEKPDFKDLQRCKREIVENCIFGVDINPLAIELARTSLYLEALVPGEPLPFLHHRLKSGNALIGADFQNKSRSAWEEGLDFPVLFDLPIEHVNPDDKLWQAWDDACGDDDSSDELKQEFEDVKKRIKGEQKGILPEEWAAWANESQLKISSFLALTQKAQEDFEKAQNSNEIVEQLDDRYKDHLALIPDMDPVLIEVYGVSIDPDLLKKRKRALLNEYGERRYSTLVKNQRAYTRLKAIGDLNTALWFWPVDEYSSYPGYKDYKELCDWLLDETSLKPKAKSKELNRKLLHILKTAVKTSKQYGFFHWQLEFASVFADPSQLGFSAVISNPPWKPLSVNKGTVLGQMVPELSKVHQEKLKKHAPDIFSKISTVEYHQRIVKDGLVNSWSYFKAPELEIKGQIDICIYFWALPLYIGAPTSRSGMLVSRKAVLINDCSQGLRTKYFNAGHVVEVLSFVNRLPFFDIDRRVRFVAVVNDFAHEQKSIRVRDNISDMVDLAKDTSISIEGEIIKNFSGDNYVLPTFSSQEQVGLLELFYSQSAIQIKDISGINLMKGYDQSHRLVKRREDVPNGKLPTVNQIVTRKNTFVPIFKGRQFDNYEPWVDGNNGQFQFERYGEMEVLNDGLVSSLPIVCWRAMSERDNQRTLIASLLPGECRGDINVWHCQGRDAFQTLILATCLGSLVLDFVVKLRGSGYIAKSAVGSLPIPNHRSEAILDAAALVSQLALRQNFASFAGLSEFTERANTFGDLPPLEMRATVDALVWIHYFQNEKVFNSSGLKWMLNTQFDCMNRQNPTYAGLVLRQFESLRVNSKYSMKNRTAIFAPTVVPITTEEKSDASIERRVTERRNVTNSRELGKETEERRKVTRRKTAI